MSASTRQPGAARSAFLIAVLALTLSAVAAAVRERVGDDLSGAWWIGHYPVARNGEEATIAFAARFSLASAAPKATLRLKASGRYEAFFDGAPVGAGPASGAVVEWPLRHPIAAGEHEILVRVSHPEGSAALRLALVCAGARKPDVVTGPGWRVDDDVNRMKKGFGGLRYPATLWARPPLSVFSASSASSATRS